MESGWIRPDEAPALPVSQFMMAMRADPDRDRTIGEVLAGHASRGRGSKPEASSQDEAVSNLLARGYAPGSLVTLSLQIDDTLGALAAEREKIARSARRQARISRDHASGKISAFDIMAMSDEDAGDASRVAMLERRAADLQAQFNDAQASAALPQRQPADGVEAAAMRARQLLGEVTRATRATRAPAPPPFGSASRGAAAECPGPGCETCAACGDNCDLCEQDHRQGAARSAGPDCAECARAGATAAESAQIHAGDFALAVR